MQLGLAYLQQGNLPVAKEKLERAEKQNPRDPQVHDALAMLYERLKEPKLVDEHFRIAVRLAPDNPEHPQQLRRFPVSQRPHGRGREPLHAGGQQPAV